MFNFRIFVFFFIILLTTTACGNFNLSEKRPDLQEINIRNAEIINSDELLMPREEAFNVLLDCSEGINFLKVAFRGEEAQYFNIELERQNKDNCNFLIKPEYLKGLGRRISVDIRAISKDFDNDIENYEDTATFFLNNKANLYLGNNIFELNQSQLIVLNEQLKAIGEYHLASEEELFLDFGATGDINHLKIELKNIVSQKEKIIEKDFFENKTSIVLNKENLLNLGDQIFVSIKAFANDDFRDSFSFLLNIKNEELVSK